MPDQPKPPDQPESRGKSPQRPPDEISRLSVLAERLRLSEYLDLLGRPWRLLWLGFLSGLGRGAGYALGGVVMLALLGLIVSRIVHTPMLGKYLAGLVQEIQRHLPR